MHDTELFLLPCPQPHCESAALCRIDYRGYTVGNCRGCEWVGRYEEVALTTAEAAK